MKYYITAERIGLDDNTDCGTVSYDNESTDNYESFMFFDSYADAEKWTESDEAKEWKNCRFTIVEDNMEEENEF